jgi:carbon storage regulator CsrA
MLVFSRGDRQRVQIGRNITVEVLDVGRSRVRIGVSAPPLVRVLRGELLARDAARLLQSTAGGSPAADDAPAS